MTIEPIWPKAFKSPLKGFYKAFKRYLKACERCLEVWYPRSQRYILLRARRETYKYWQTLTIGVANVTGAGPHWRVASSSSPTAA